MLHLASLQLLCIIDGQLSSFTLWVVLVLLKFRLNQAKVHLSHSCLTLLSRPNLTLRWVTLTPVTGDVSSWQHLCHTGTNRKTRQWSLAFLYLLFLLPLKKNKTISALLFILNQTKTKGVLDIAEHLLLFRC